MKKLTYILIFLIVLIVSYSLYSSQEPVSVVHNNTTYHPISFTLKKTNDTISKMLIRDYENACEVVLQNGDTWFFAESADMVLWLKTQPIGTKKHLWVYTIDTHRWIDATIAWYGIRDKTVMGYGFGARERRVGDAIDYEEMKKRVLHSQTLLNPKVRKKLLQDNYKN